MVFSNKPLESCYGCSACQQVCAHQAIQMVSNEEGFLYPVINNEKCVDCGLCTKVCPTQTSNILPLFNPTPEIVYAAWEKQINDRLESTSGGAFFALASKVINKGGVVYGVTYDSNLLARHQRIDNIEDLKKSRGSKYMQSNINTTYRQAKKDLQEGLSVLFSGTPCQIAGLKLFLRKEYPNLFTIDLVCHGVPSPALFKDHVAWIEKKYGKKMINFKFRAKKESGWRSYVKYYFEDYATDTLFLGEDYYSHAFHQGYFSRKSCFECEFSKAQRIADITLSDFWNGEKYSRILKKQRKYGFNLIMCNTSKGRELMKESSINLELLEMPVKAAIEGDVRLRHTEKCPSFRESSYKMWKENGYEYMVNNYSSKNTLVQKMLPTWVKNIIREIQSIL